MPARARLDKRQAAFAIRLASAPSGPHAGLLGARIGLRVRLRESLGQASSASATVERSVIGQGRAFPGVVAIPPPGTRTNREERIGTAAEEARIQEHDPDTMWTDGSKLGGGDVGCGVAWYEEVKTAEPPVLIGRRGVLGIGERREPKGTTYLDRQRSVRGARSGWRGVGFGMGHGHEAYDAELAAIACGLLHLTARRGIGKLYHFHGHHRRNDEINQRCSRTGTGDGHTHHWIRPADCQSGQLHHH